MQTCDKSDNKSGDSSGGDGDDQSLEAEEDDARLHGRTVRSKKKKKGRVKTADAFSYDVANKTCQTFGLNPQNFRTKFA